MKHVILLLSFLLLSSHVYAWPRMPYEDAVVVERSEVIVIGHLKKDSIQFVLHKEGNSWEYHATLVITEVLKGKQDKKEMPVIIGYGIDPLVGGVWLTDRFWIKTAPIPADQVDLYDTGGVEHRILEHAERDNLWFLRRRPGVFGEAPGNGDFGTKDPQDIQPLDLKDYFKTYLEKNQEASIKKYVAEHPALLKRAQSYFDHLEVQRILALEDLETRAKRLVPYFLKWQHWTTSWEAHDGLVACGNVVGPLLLAPFNDPAFTERRIDVMQVWGTIHDRDAVGLLVDLLKQHDKFWAAQDLNDGWWSTAVDSEQNKTRRRIYGEVGGAVSALDQIGDIRAKEAIELTAKRWPMFGVGTKLKEACERIVEKWEAEK